MTSSGAIVLFDCAGGRKYVCAKERRRFLLAAKKATFDTQLFCRLLVYSGARVSEALSITPLSLDTGTGRIVFRTLKRRKVIHRAVPLPHDLMADLCARSSRCGTHERLWSWSRQTAWRRVKAVMQMASIAGPQATPRGLRHGFGIASMEGSVPMPAVQRWMGHSKLETTAIYQQAAGREERALARRLWRSLEESR